MARQAGQSPALRALANFGEPVMLVRSPMTMKDEALLRIAGNQEKNPEFRIQKEDGNTGCPKAKINARILNSGYWLLDSLHRHQAMASGSSPLSRSLRSGAVGGTWGLACATACAMAAMCAGVEPQQPPTMLSQPFAAKSPKTFAMAAGGSS